MILGERDRVDKLCSRGISYGKREAPTTLRNCHNERGIIELRNTIFLAAKRSSTRALVPLSVRLSVCGQT